VTNISIVLNMTKAQKANILDTVKKTLGENNKKYT